MATNRDELLKNADLENIAKKGSQIYQRVKVKYDPKDKGKFLAVEVDSEDIFLGDTSADALELARKSHPDKVFYVTKIGYNAAETMAKTYYDAD